MSDENVVINVVGVKYKKVPPEGGWGYIVGIGMALTFVVTLGPLTSYGVIYADFFDKIGAKATALTVGQSVYFASFSLTGLLANYLLKTFSCRQIGLVGATLFTLGSFLTIFVSSVVHLIITYSIMQGIGFGLMVPVVFTNFNAYFVKRRNMVLMATKPLVGVLSMFYPAFIFFLMSYYGFRGTLAILAALNAHSVLAMISMQPVSKHMKLVKDDSEEEIQQDPLLSRNGVAQVNIQSEASENPSDQEEIMMAEINRSEIRNINDIKNKGRIQKSIHALVEFMDLTLLKDLSYVNRLIGIAIAEFSELSFLTLYPVYLLSIGWSKRDVAICLSTGGIADLVGRVCLALLGPCLKVKNKYIFLFATSVTVLGRIAFIFVNTITGVLGIISILSFFKAFMAVTVPLIFAEHFPQRRFPAAYGLYMFIQGIFILALGPLVGIIKDATDSYLICFIAQIVCLLICVIPWLLEFGWVAAKRKCSRGNKNSIKHS